MYSENAQLCFFLGEAENFLNHSHLQFQSQFLFTKLERDYLFTCSLKHTVTYGLFFLNVKFISVSLRDMKHNNMLLLTACKIPVAL